MIKQFCRLELGEKGQKIFSKNYITFVGPFKIFQKSIFDPHCENFRMKYI